MFLRLYRVTTASFLARFPMFFLRKFSSGCCELVVSASEVDCAKRFVDEMTCYSQVSRIGH